MLWLVKLMLVALTDISTTLKRIEKRETKIMATLADVVALLDAVASGVDSLETAIAALKAEVAAGHVVTQEELDSLAERAASIVTDISDTSDQG